MQESESSAQQSPSSEGSGAKGLVQQLMAGGPEVVMGFLAELDAQLQQTEGVGLSELVGGGGGSQQPQAPAPGQQAPGAQGGGQMPVEAGPRSGRVSFA